MVSTSDPGPPQHPWRVRCSGTVRLPPGIAAPLTLFTPEGERAWVAGWEPSYPAETDDDSEPGTVFQTRSGAHSGTWVVTSREPERSIRYTRVIPEQDAGTVTVTLDGSNQVTVSYDLTALSELGAAHLAQFAAGYPQFLAHWEQAILLCASAGALLPGASARLTRAPFGATFRNSGTRARPAPGGCRPPTGTGSAW